MAKNITVNKNAGNKNAGIAGRVAGLVSTIKSGIKALSIAHLSAGRVRMMPIYEVTHIDWLDERGQPHRKVEQDWIGLAYYQNERLIYEVRWGRRGGASVEHHKNKLPGRHE